MKAFNEIIKSYDVQRDLEIVICNNNVLVYEYVQHTKDEEGGDFLGEFGYAEVESSLIEIGKEYLLGRFERI